MPVNAQLERFGLVKSGRQDTEVARVHAPQLQLSQVLDPPAVLLIPSRKLAESRIVLRGGLRLGRFSSPFVAFALMTRCRRGSSSCPTNVLLLRELIGWNGVLGLRLGLRCLCRLRLWWRRRRSCRRLSRGRLGLPLSLASGTRERPLDVQVHGPFHNLSFWCRRGPHVSHLLFVVVLQRLPESESLGQSAVLQRAAQGPMRQVAPSRAPGAAPRPLAPSEEVAVGPQLVPLPSVPCWQPIRHETASTPLARWGPRPR